MNRTSYLCEHNAKVIATSAYFLCISEQDVETMEMVAAMVTSRTLLPPAHSYKPFTQICIAAARWAILELSTSLLKVSLCLGKALTRAVLKIFAKQTACRFWYLRTRVLISHHLTVFKRQQGAFSGHCEPLLIALIPSQEVCISVSVSPETLWRYYDIMTL